MVRIMLEILCVCLYFGNVSRIVLVSCFLFTSLQLIFSCSPLYKWRTIIRTKDRSYIGFFFCFFIHKTIQHLTLFQCLLSSIILLVSPQTLQPHISFLLKTSQLFVSLVLNFRYSSNIFLIFCILCYPLLLTNFTQQNTLQNHSTQQQIV